MVNAVWCGSHDRRYETERRSGRTVSVVPIAVNRRIPASVGLVLTVIAGLTVRAVTEGVPAKVGGDALYGTMVYVLLVLCRPRLRPAVAAGIAVVICWLIEFAQLTPFPAAASRHSVVARLVLGSTFYLPDLASYIVGIVLGLLVHRLIRRPSATKPSVQPAIPGE